MRKIIDKTLKRDIRSKLKSSLILFSCLFVLNACVVDGVIEDTKTNESENVKEISDNEICWEKVASCENSHMNDPDRLLKAIKERQSIEAFRQLYDFSYEYDVTPTIKPLWKRTDVHSSFPAELKITEVGCRGFGFNLNAMYFLNIGAIEATAKYVNKDLAIAKVEGVGDQYLIFILNNENIEIIASGRSGDIAGLGGGVFVDGVYITGDPIYTNTGILNKTFTEDELSALMDILPKEKYEKYFLFVTENGIVNTEITKDGEKYIEAYCPTWSEMQYSIRFDKFGNCTVCFFDGSEYIYNKLLVE